MSVAFARCIALQIGSFCAIMKRNTNIKNHVSPSYFFSVSE